MSTRPNHTDPTYLRTIHDGLLSGAVHKDNASALPMGLVGMYEEALPPAANVNERKKFLEFFSRWALLKKEVSAEFVLPLLEGWTEDQVIDYIAQYSKWFNSPVSGKYVLYHERLRTFILQKLSHHQFEKCNEQIIHQCQLALQAKIGDEWERYTLEFLSTHLLIQAMDSKDGEALKALSYNTTHWNRQIEISKGFEWSKRMLNDMMLWASKYDDDEVIECALNKVDLHHLEQNDASRIVELVAQNDIETALQRIESFGGNDKEGLQRKFILYMLCLMELTLLDSKEKPFRKEAIEKLLKHLDDNLPVDHSVLNWNDFFPSYLMFKMAFEWAFLGLDYLLLFQRTEDLERDWIKEKGPYCEQEFDIMLACANGIIDLNIKNDLLLIISIELSKQGLVEESLFCANKIRNYEMAGYAFKNISAEFARKSFADEALRAIQMAIECADMVDVNSRKSDLQEEICLELMSQGEMEMARIFARTISDVMVKSYLLSELCSKLAQNGLMTELITLPSEIKDLGFRDSAYKNISIELARRGQIVDAFHYARYIMDEVVFSIALAKIGGESNFQGKVDTADSAMKQALLCAEVISNESSKCKALIGIIGASVEQGNIDEALEWVNLISIESSKSSALRCISNELACQQQWEESLTCARRIIDLFERIESLNFISYKLFQIGSILRAQSLIHEVLDYCSDISDESQKCKVLVKISDILSETSQRESNTQLLLKALAIARSITSYYFRNSAIASIIKAFLNSGEIELALNCTLEISYGSEKRKVLADIINRIANLTDNLVAASAMQIALCFSLRISDNWLKGEMLKSISSEFTKLESISDAAFALQTAIDFNEHASLEFSNTEVLQYMSSLLATQGHFQNSIVCAKEIIDDSKRDQAINVIITMLTNRDMIEEASDCIRYIKNQSEKCNAIMTVTKLLLKEGHLEHAERYINQLYEYINDISDEENKSNVLLNVSCQLSKQGHVLKALSFARKISLNKVKFSAFTNVSSELENIGYHEDATMIAKESMSIFDGIDDDYFKSLVLKDFSAVKANSGNLEEATKIIRQSMSFANRIVDEYWKYDAFKDISVELAFQGKKKEALYCIRRINDIDLNCNAKKEVCSVLAQQGQIKSALAIARRIGDPYWKSNALKEVSLELAKRGKITEAEVIGIQIPQIAERYDCWQELAQLNLRNSPWKKLIFDVKIFKRDEARNYYVKGLFTHVVTEDVTADCIKMALPFIGDDTEIIKALLFKYAIQEVFLNNKNGLKLQRLNRTLNIQWAIDIAAQFPKEETTARLSTNLETWLHEIADEDDREQIELWAKQVVKGKITEEEFGERVKELM